MRKKLAVVLLLCVVSLSAPASARQAYAARGYAVLYLNPRGSTGYGQKFSDGTFREWGGGDFRDLMAGVDEGTRRWGVMRGSTRSAWA